MKTEVEIETLLRKAPAPQPAPHLATSLKSAIKLPGPANGADLELSVPLWRRWFPALAYAVLILGCVVVLAVQNNQQRELIRQNEQLRAEITVAEEAVEEGQQQLAQMRSAAREIEQLQRDAAEADRLAARLAELQAQIAALNAQAQELETQLAVVPENQKMIAPYDFFGSANSPLNEARENATSITCINNLKQIGLAIIVFAHEHNQMLPRSLNELSNQLNLPSVLCCPEDSANRELAKSLSHLGKEAWTKWPLNGGSYEFLTPGISVSSPNYPSAVLARCRIHGHIVRGDGSAHQAQGRN